MSCVPLFLAVVVQSTLAKQSTPYWPQRGGNSFGNGHTEQVAPSDLSRKPSWTWDNPDDELFRHTPVVDGENNIYAVTAVGYIRKFSPDGKILWTWRNAPEDGKFTCSPFLSDGQLFIFSVCPQVQLMGSNYRLWSFDMETGAVNWKAPGPMEAFPQYDSTAMMVSNGVIVGSARDLRKPRPANLDGDHRVWAANASNGDPLWTFNLDSGNVWNFLPVTNGDGTFYFATACARAQRYRLATGELIWRNGPTDPGIWCSTGGASLGPNGVLYAEGNYNQGNTPSSFYAPFEDQPRAPACSMSQGCPGGHGLMVAYNAEDGKVLWARRFGPFGGYQYPGIAVLNGRLSVVAAIGQNPSLPVIQHGEDWLPWIVRELLSNWQYHSLFLRRWFFRFPTRRNAILVLDAETGDDIWQWEEEPWTHHAAIDDEGPSFKRRIARTIADPLRWEAVCGPDNWGIPSIGGDGTVYASSGSTGNLYAIRDENNNGIIEDSEVSTLETKEPFLNGPAIAPGMLVVTPCWGRMYVFKSS